MKRVLITGASGILGQEVLKQLDTGAYKVRVLRHRKPGTQSDTLETVTGDLATGEGLAEAVKEVDVVLHLAHIVNNPKLDVANTSNFVKLARETGVNQFIYQSIVGIDRVPYSYYKGKLAIEQVVQESGLSWTIFRATQFHPFVDQILQTLDRLPVMLVPRKLLVQPVDPSEVAARLVVALQNGTTGFLPELGGPQILTLGELAQSWQAARGSHKSTLNLPLPGKVAAALKKGYNTTVQTGQISWQTWLERHYRPESSGLAVRGL